MDKRDFLSAYNLIELIELIELIKLIEIKYTNIFWIVSDYSKRSNYLSTKCNTLSQAGQRIAAVREIASRR